MNEKSDAATALDQFFDALPDAPLLPDPPGLDAETAAFVRQLVRAEHAALQDDEALRSRVWERVQAAAHPVTATGRRQFPAIPSARAAVGNRRRRVRRSAGARLALVAALLLAVIGIARAASRSQPVAAQDILQRAVVISQGDPAAAGVRSFSLHWESSDQDITPDGRVRPTTTSVDQWGATPNRWYTAQHGQRADGTGESWDEGVVSDGNSLWSYRTDHGGTTAAVGALPADVTVPMPRIPIGIPWDGAQTAEGMAQLRAALARCYQPQREGTATIAGRPAYVLALGPTACSPGVALDASGTITPLPSEPPARQGRTLLWVDTETFFLLQSEHTGPDGTLQWRNTVTRIGYNTPVPDDRFVYAPPPGAVVTDFRPREYQPQPGVVLPTTIIFKDGRLRVTPVPTPPSG